MEKEQLAQGVKDFRKRKGLSQDDLSKKSGLSLRTIQRVENGESVPTGETLKRIAAVLEVAPSELIDWGSKKEISKKTVKTKYEYLHVFNNKLLITQTMQINDLVEDYGKSVNNVFKTLIVFFIFIPLFTTLSLIAYNMGNTGLAIYSGAVAFCFLVVAIYIILFTSGTSLIKLENITRIKMKKQLFNSAVFISHKESGRVKVRTLILEKNQVETMKHTLYSENLIEERDIQLKGYNIYLFLIPVVLMSSQFYTLFFKEIDSMMVNGFIISFVGLFFLVKMLVKLISPFTL